MTGPAEQAESTAVPAQRSGRHAAPRTPVRVRLRGRALAMAAVPTALLMAAAYTPNPAVAESAAGKPCGNAPVTVPDVAPIETPVPKSELPEPPPAPSGTAGTSGAASTGAPSAGPGSVPTTTPTQAPTKAPTTAPVKPSATGTATTPPAVRSAATGGSGAVSAVYQGTADGTATASRAGLIDDLVGGINHLLNPGGSASPTPTATPSATPQAPAAPAPRVGTPAQPSQSQPQAPSTGAQSSAGQSSGTQSSGAQPSAGQPSPGATPSGGKSSTKAAPSATPSSDVPATPAATATPSASPTANPNCDVDARNLTAGKATAEQVVPEQNWTLRSSRLGLHGAAFHGVYDVKTPTGTKRVLKFVVDSVDIENLDMSTLEGNGVTFHVQGAPGSTSTMRNGQVTMYVERLSGHLSKVLGLPIPIDLGEITLTPDTLPRWLYDLIGSVPIPLDLELTGVTAKQAGQFGGTLHIPGMHLFNDNAPYSDK
ncbi:hypothetical protein ACIG0C_03175 [Kitasatospora aureofaciens]|uniref:Uncharacterized protein n=1 Tax=Kitasatospora aureofaciens TaxID=1894 RepID=A0A1E7N871_KITAU|nr:hypothetical protein [Kitasatospora aureofaciens]ARF78655.1 hypothetical protein B6264_06780 [Kitasatospora aureofaciens]OEV36896.1 hypothetical protein HS99_0026905 [Kitasatospora aureofaciens]GGU78466.1 hypothetical protein GCM10010502_33090 [Kitasatospora aureofaciens]